jgi:parallel beta-helix repeat protein
LLARKFKIRIVLRRNLAQYNVAGIEIENSTDADVYENLAPNNTGGILVFNLPGLPFIDGRRTRVFDNDIVDNNTQDFAPAGTTVAGVPTGTGLANDEVEVFDNNFDGNNTSHKLLISFGTAELAGVGDRPRSTTPTSAAARCRSRGLPISSAVSSACRSPTSSSTATRTRRNSSTA